MRSVAAARQLVAYDRWSNDRMLAALQQLEEPDDDLLAIAGHIFAAIERWACRIDGTMPESDLGWRPRSLEQIATLGANAQGHLAAILDSLDEAGLGNTFESPGADGRVFVQRIDDVLLHVALHGAEHRGQCWLLIRQQGGPTEAPDAAWYRFGQEEAQT
jgi:uncharacterized damage-inducible protein DinB